VLLGEAGKRQHLLTGLFQHDTGLGEGAGELLHTRWCWASTSASSGWVKMERTKVATMVWVDSGTWVSRLRRKCTRQRGQEVPARVAASAALSLKWSSEIASCTPVSALCGRSRRTLRSRPGAKPTSKRDPAGQQQEDDNDGDDAEQDVEHSPSAALETSLHGLPPSKPTRVAPRFPRRDSSETIPSPGAGSC
jgi:hypothetical protein